MKTHNGFRTETVFGAIWRFGIIARLGDKKSDAFAEIVYNSGREAVQQ